MNREINDHKVNAANDTLSVRAIDEQGSGGAHHAYLISGFDNTTNPSDPDYAPGPDTCLILFQNGPIGVDGNCVNGVTNEALLAVVADRLRCFQKGQYSCKANACALTHIEEAMHWLQQRTIERMRRGVEGTHTV